MDEHPKNDNKIQHHQLGFVYTLVLIQVVINLIWVYSWCFLDLVTSPRNPTKPPLNSTKPGCNAKADRHICLVSLVFRVENSAADEGTKVSNKNLQLVGGWTNPSEKYARQIGPSSPNRGENKKYLKPPPSQPISHKGWRTAVESRVEKIFRYFPWGKFFQSYSWKGWQLIFNQSMSCFPLQILLSKHWDGWKRRLLLEVIF